MNILRMVKNHIKINGWPEEPARVGPATCGQPRYSNRTECRTVHAYAEAIKQTSMFEETTYVFIYARPCNTHDGAKKISRELPDPTPYVKAVQAVH